MRRIIDVLENALKHWEDNGFIRTTMQLITDRLGMDDQIYTPDFPEIMANWRGLRDHLMQAQSGAEFDTARFLGGENFSSMAGRQAGHNTLLPLSLWQWTKSSRRVFQIHEDLQALLRVTSFQKDVKAGDIRMPFPSFLMTLARPIRRMDASGRIDSYDAILAFMVPPEIVGNPEAQLLGFYMFSAELLDYKAIGSFDRDAIGKALHKNEYLKLSDKTLRLQDRLDAAAPYLWIYFARLDNLRDVDERKLRQEVGEAAVEALRLVLGLSCYLQILPTGTSHRSAWKKPGKSDKPDPRAITNTAELCTVTSVHTLSLEERERFFRESMATGRETSAHFRRGHWRKPPGSGQDPTAEKIIWVRPTMVRQDRLKPGEELAGGTLTIFK